MKIENKSTDSRGQFEANDNEKRAGIMTYSRHEDRIVLEHTEVDPEYQGKGVGKKLVQKSAEFARENNLKIVPECNYAKKVLEKSSDYDDVL